MAASGTNCRSSASWPGKQSTSNHFHRFKIQTSTPTGGTVMDTGKSALGIDGNLAAALGYPVGILAIICLIMEKENRFVKFHALQSILLHVGMMVVGFAIGIIFMILGIVLGVAAGAGGGSAAGGLA